MSLVLTIDSTYVVSPDFGPTVVPEGYIWDETAFKELVKATDKATADQTIFTYGGPQGDANVDYLNAADLTISNLKYNGEGQVVETTVTANSFNNTGTVTTDGAIIFSVKSFTNFGEFDLDKNGELTATSAVMNMEDGTINLNAGSTLTGSTVVNAGTITVVSDHATINGAITNHGTIDALMKKLTVTGDIQNANKDDARIVRNACVIKAREFEVTGNVVNYGAIGGESIPVNTMTVSGSLSTYNYLKATILTADSILNDSIQSEVEGEGSRGFIDAGEINAGSVDNVSGIIMTGTSKETGVGINVTGTINNGSADLVVPAKINAGTNGWIKAASINNIGTDIENSLITAGKITVADIVNNGGFSTRIIENTGTITNNATGLFAVIYIDDPIVTGFVEGASINAGTIINGGTFAVYSEAALPTPVSVTSIENSGLFEFTGVGFTLTGDIFNKTEGQLDVAGTVTGTATITNSGTLNISNDDDVSGVLTVDAVTNTKTGTINLNAGSTLTGSTVVNAGTITVVSDHATINGAITNHGTIDALMKKLIVTGDIQNANYDDTKNPRDNSIIIAREFEVTGNVVNYGIIGEVDREIHTFDVSGELSNGFQILVDILTADSIENKSITSLDIEKSTRAYIVAGEVNAGSIDNVFGTIQTGEPKESGVGLNVTGTINNGNADNDSAEINAGLNGWIQAGSLNNIGTDYEKSLIETGKLTVGNIVNNGGISARIVESTGTITNNATGLFAVLYIDDPTITGLSEAASLTATKIINGGTFYVSSEAALPTAVNVTSIENSGLFEFTGVGFTLTGDIFNKTEGQIDVAGTVTGTGSITNSGTISISNDDDISGALATGAITNTATGTISLDDDSTLTGTTVINGGTITVASGHAALNGAISNHSLIDSVMKTLNVTGDIQNANEDDMREARNSSIIKIRNLNVTGNVTNYGVIGTEFQEANDITISGDLRNFHQIIVKTTLTADSVYQDYIDSEVEEKRCVGYIICGQVIAGEINNASGEISAGADKDAGIAIEATGKITNGKADALFTATLQAGDDGCIQAVDALNNIGAGSTVHAGYITVLKGTEAGDLTNDGIIQTKSITVDGSVTNSATGSIEIDGASTEPGNLSGTSIGNAGTLNLNGNVTLSGDVDNSNLLNFQGTVTATGAITNAETGTLNIKSAGSIAGNSTITNSGTLHIAIQSGKENKITADKFYNTEGVGKITIGGSFAGGVANVITATEGDVKVSDITLSVTSADEKEVTAATRGGNVSIASGVDYSTIYLSNGIDEDADFAKEVQDSTGASYYVDFNAFKLPASALKDGVKDTTATILIDGTTASALKYESETTAAIDGLAFAKDGTNGAAPEEEKNVELVLTGMDPANPESYRDLKKGITVGAGVTLTVDKLRQTGENAVTNIDGELRAGTYNTGLSDDPATADVDESVGTGTVQVAAGQVNVNGGGALYDCTVVSGGTVTVYEGGHVEDIAMENGGRLDVNEGGVASAATVNFGGDLYVSDGGKAIQVMENGGYVNFDEGNADVTFVSNTFSGLSLYGLNWATVHSGTTATDTTINADGGMFVFDGGVASATIVNSEGVLALHDGGIADTATVNVGGEIRVSSGGTATKIRENGGYVEIEEGANVTFVSNTISGLVLNEYDYATVHSGTTVNDVSINSECELEVFSGGVAGDVAVNADGALSVYDGGIAIVVTVNEKGVLEVTSGGTVNDVTVNGGGTAEVSSGVIDCATVNAGGGLLVYRGAKLTGWMTFESGAEVIPFVGSILDFDLTQTSAGSSALVNDLSVLMGKPSYTLTVDGNESDGTYRLAGGASKFNETITVVNTSGTELGTLMVGGEDLDIDGKIYTLALNGSDLSVTVDPGNRPDDGTNDLLYDKSNKTWNDANITVENWISASSLEEDNTVYLDVPGSINQMDSMHNMVGYNTPDPDTGDTARIFVQNPAKLTFQIESTVAGTFYVYKKVYDNKKGTYKQVQIGKVSVKKNTPAYLKDVCLTVDGEYFVQMAASSSAYKKEGAKGYYNVKISSSTFFDDVDNGWNGSYASAIVQEEPVLIGRGTSFVALDNNIESAGDWNFVGGISDAADFARLDLESSAFLSFTVTGDGADTKGTAKFTIWKFNGTKGLKKVTSVTLKNGKYTQTTKGVFLDKDGEYYISMESTDAAKGKAVYYKVEVNTSGTRFFDSADDNRNNVLYDKAHKTVYGEDKTHHFFMNKISSSSPTFILDDNPIGLEGYENFVGYGDKVDYAKFTVTEKGTLSFTVKATEGATFEVWTLVNGKLKSLGKTKLKLGKNQTTCSGSVSNLLLEVDKEYYVSMTAAKTTANTKGSVFYSVTATLVVDKDSSSLTMPETVSVASALTMPETDSLGMSDALSFSGYDADVLANASASSLAEMDDKSAYQNLSMLA